MHKNMIEISSYTKKHGYCEVAIPVGNTDGKQISFVYSTDNSGSLEAYDFVGTDEVSLRTRSLTDNQLKVVLKKYQDAYALLQEYIQAKGLQRYQLINPEGMIYRTFPLRYREVDGVQCEKLVKFTDGQLIGFAIADPDPFVEAYENNPGLRFAVEVIDEYISQ